MEPQHPISQVAHAVFDTNRLLIGRAESEHAHLQGVGCTAAAIAFSGRIAYLLNVGSDRIYLWRNNQLTQLSTDDKLIEEIKRLGTFSPEEIANYPYKNIITKAIGINRHLVPTQSHIGVQDGDVFLLCTDGLTSVINDEQLSHFFKSKKWNTYKEEQTAKTLEDHSQELVQMAIDADSTDNITVLLVQAKWTNE
jgi:protein phosphatase